MKYQPPYGAPGADDPYINGDPSIARQGSILPAAAAEYPQREIVNFIGNSDMTPADNDLQQLTKASRSQWVNFCVDTGSVNALSVALTPALGEYKQGLPIRVLVKNQNTGASTINVNSLGNRAVVRANGAQLEGGDLRQGMIALLVDDGTKFQLVNFQGILASAINNVSIDIPYAEDTGTVNNVKGIYLPAITTTQSGDLVLIKIANKNTAAVMFTVNNLAAVPIRRNDGQPLQAQDLELNEILLLVYNVNCWQVLRLVRSQVFFKLNQDLILYVRTDGDDVFGDGSANEAGKAFKTVNRAIAYVQGNFLIGGRTVTIQLGIPGNYTNPGWGNAQFPDGRVVISNLPGRLVIRGDPNNILGYSMQGPAGNPVGHGHVLYATGSGTDVTLQGLTLTMADGVTAVCQSTYGAQITIDNVAISGISTYGPGFVASANAGIIVFNNVHCYVSLGALWQAIWNASITIGQWYTNTHSHGVNYYAAWAQATTLGSIYVAYGWANFSGTAYGAKFQCTYNSVISTASGNVNFLPGTAPGYVDGSSVYY